MRYVILVLIVSAFVSLVNLTRHDSPKAAPLKPSAHYVIPPKEKTAHPLKTSQSKNTQPEIRITSYLPDTLVNGKQTCRWSDKTKVIYVTVHSGLGVTGWNPAMNTVVKNAFSDWQKAMKNRIKFAYTDDPSKTDISISWSDLSNGPEIGITTSNYSDNLFTIGEIKLYLTNPSTNKPFNDTDLKATVLHEIGHALGVKGHSPYPGDLMYYMAQKGVNTLSSRDVETMRLLYSRPAQITNPDGIHAGQFRIFDYFFKNGHEQLNLNKPALAYQFFNTAKKHYPGDKRIDFFIAAAAYDMGRYDEAIVGFKRAEHTPDFRQPSSRLLLAESYLQKARQAGEVRNEKAVISNLNNAVIYFKQVEADQKAQPELKTQSAGRLTQIKSMLLKVYS